MDRDRRCWWGLPGVVGAEASEQTCDVPVCNLVLLARILDMKVHPKNIHIILYYIIIRYSHMSYIHTEE